MKSLRIGTRKSKLALWQAKYIQSMLHAGGISSELVLIETAGDKILDLAISKIGSKGVFTQEIEENLRHRRIDVAVHSAKDMPSELPSDLELIAYTAREKPNDVLVSNQRDISLDDPGIVVGTSSTRRIAFLKHYFPQSRQVEMRGNLQTRIQKMESGQCDGLLLAFAGAHRLNYDGLIAEELPVTQFVPPAGQGSITLESRKDWEPETRNEVRKIVNDSAAEACIQAERGFLQGMQGGCSVPVFSYAEMSGGDIYLSAGIIGLDGAEMIMDSGVTDAETTPESLGQSIAHRVLEQGGDKILVDIREELGN